MKDTQFYEELIETELKKLEKEYNIDLSRKSKDRKSFLILLRKVSPKDKYGDVERYADFKDTYEKYINN